MDYPRDRHRLYCAAFLRATGFSMMAVLLGAYLVKLDVTPFDRGMIIAVGLGSCTLVAGIITRYGDRLGRRRMLIAIALMSGIGGALLAMATSLWAIAVAAGIGMLNAMGKDRGAALVLEQAMIPATVQNRKRTSAFAWYHVAQDIGHALGAGAAATPILFHHFGMDELTALRWAMGAASLLVMASAVCYSGLSTTTEIAKHATQIPMSPATRKVVRRISGLFLIDAVGGGFLTTTWLSAFFIEHFSADLPTISALFVAARILNAVSHLGAVWLARHIGLVNTMVFTHIPASLFLLSVPIAPNFTVAAILFLLREGLVEMDVPTRQSYLMAVIGPEDRTRASGVTSIVRMGGWTIGQACAGAVGQVTLGLSLTVGAGMKIVYDLMLYSAFRSVKPPEELDTPEAASS